MSEPIVQLFIIPSPIVTILLHEVATWTEDRALPRLTG